MSKLSAHPHFDGEIEPEYAWCNHNDYVQPDCGGFSPQHPGIQECMRAASCRAITCHWAACINLLSGGTYAWWIGQNLACAAVADMEFAACMTILPFFP